MQRGMVIGVGNDMRGDDAAGLLVVQRLRPRLPHMACHAASGEGTALLELWQGTDRVVLIDAVTSHAPPGMIHRIEVHRQPIPATLQAGSTHSFGVAAAIEMARVLGMLPAYCVLYGIEGACFALGAPLSPAVATAVTTLVERIAHEIDQPTTANS